MEENQKTPCVSCRLITIACLFSIGGYFIKLGLTNKPKFVYRLIGAGTVGLGIGEIFNYSPFREKTTETQT